MPFNLRPTVLLMGNLVPVMENPYIRRTESETEALPPHQARGANCFRSTPSALGLLSRFTPASSPVSPFTTSLSLPYEGFETRASRPDFSRLGTIDDSFCVNRPVAVPLALTPKPSRAASFDENPDEELLITGFVAFPKDGSRSFPLLQCI